MTRTYWLSFCDDDKPKGTRFLGVAIVDVTQADADEALTLINVQFPNHQGGAEWIAAATRRAHTLGCNPGGNVGTIDITDIPHPDGNDVLPKGRLLSKAELVELGLV